jgi:hypothetical protein
MNPNELNKLLEEELKRRMKSSSNAAETLRGFVDFARKATAKFLFANPAFESEWAQMRTNGLFSSLESASSEDHYQNLLDTLQIKSPLSRATSECPEFSLQPPTLHPPNQWSTTSAILPTHSDDDSFA